MPTGVELATAWVRLVPTMDGVQGEVVKALDPVDKAAEEAGKRSGGKFTNGMKVAMAAGATVVAGAAVKIFQTGMEELKFGEQINAQTDLLIKNTGFTMATEQINDYTLALSQVSGVSEEDLQAAGNNIIKFGNVSEENYQKAVASINDLAATGKDASTVSEGLGKALADPATAAGKLRRMGIQLNEQQEAQIATMVEAGDTAGAQGVILDSLEQTYGGMAEAAGGTLEGNLNKLNNAFENLAGDLVTAVMPAVEGIVAGLQDLITWVSENQWVIPVFGTAIGILAAAFIGLTVATWAMNTALLANPITWIVIGVVALIAAIVALIANWDAVVAFVSDIWAGFIDWITGVIEGFVGWWNGIWAAVGQFISDIWTNIVSGVQSAWDGMMAWFVEVGVGLILWWNDLWGGFSKTVEDIWTGIGNFIGTALQAALDVAKAPINALIDLINGVIDGLNTISVEIPDWVPILGGSTFGVDLPKLPHLAKGATVLPRPGGTAAILAEAGRPESVVDTGLMNRALEEGLSGNGSGGPVAEFNIYPSEGMSEETIGQIAAEKLAFALRG